MAVAVDITPAGGGWWGWGQLVARQHRDITRGPLVTRGASVRHGEVRKQREQIERQGLNSGWSEKRRMGRTDNLGTGVRIINNKSRIAPERQEILPVPSRPPTFRKVQYAEHSSILRTSVCRLPRTPQFAPGWETSALPVLLHWAVRAAHTPLCSCAGHTREDRAAVSTHALVKPTLSTW